MKSEVNSYIQMSFREFVRRFPDAASSIPMLDVFLKDPHYIVRLKENKLEIGYTEDAWEVK